VIKLDYQDGAGSGRVIWKLGNQGDFAMQSSDPYPWFSHQHGIEINSADTLVTFDDGNTRRIRPGGGVQFGRHGKDVRSARSARFLLVGCLPFAVLDSPR
jgi:hypothetical protein